MLVALKDRHFLSISATRFRRESTPLAVDDLDLGDLGIASGEVSVWINSNDLDVSYGYRLFRDDHIRILGKVGIYTLDLDAEASIKALDQALAELPADRFPIHHSDRGTDATGKRLHAANAV